MDNIIEVSFYEHLDEDENDIGYAEFVCPSCNSLIHDYSDLWWVHDSPKVSDNNCESYCRACKKTFLMDKTSDYYKYNIKEKK